MLSECLWQWHGANASIALAQTEGVVLPDPSTFLSETEWVRLANLVHLDRRGEFLAGRYALRCLWQHRQGGELGEFPLLERRGLPPLPLRKDLAMPHLSISHGGGFVAAAISSQPIGIDVEAADRVLNPKIFAPLLDSKLNSPADFLCHWVATEANLKRFQLPALPEHLRAHRLQLKPDLRVDAISIVSVIAGAMIGISTPPDVILALQGNETFVAQSFVFARNPAQTNDC